MTADPEGLSGALPPERYPRLLDLLRRLEEAGLPHTVKAKPASIRVDVRLPDWRWEIKFTPDGVVEIARFRSVSGVQRDPALLEDLFGSP